MALREPAFLYMKDGTKIHPYIHGGGQQQGNEIGNRKCTWYRRTGTGGGKNGCFFDRAKRIPVWVKALFCEETGGHGRVTVNGVQGEELEQTAPHIVSASFQGCAVRYSYMPWKTNRSMCLPAPPALPIIRESAARWWPSECQKSCWIPRCGLVFRSLQQRNNWIIRWNNLKNCFRF